MRTIDLRTWPRYPHYKLFRSFDHPHYSLGANLDVSEFYPAVKERGISLSAAILYVITRAANQVGALRQRMRGDSVVEHDVVHPSFTVLAENELFGFCHVEYTPVFTEFARRVVEQIASVRENPTLQDEPGRDDRLFMTALPWVSFTSFTHPMNLQAGDSIPRFIWGKIFAEGGRWKMPVGVQAHHALVDGLHLSQFFEAAQALATNFASECLAPAVD